MTTIALLQDYQLTPSPELQGFSGLLHFARDPLAALEEARRLHGPFVSYSQGKFHTSLLMDPPLIDELLRRQADSILKDHFTQALVPILGRGLVTNDGAPWKAQRRLLAPSFQPRHIEAYADVMVERAQETFGRFRAGEVRDFHHEMMHLALDVVLATLFGSDAGRAQGIGALLDSATADYRRLGMTFRGAFPRWFPFWSRLRYHWAGWRLRRIVERLVRGRQEKPLTNDMLSRLLEARDEGGVGMTQRQLIDECLTVMLAGHETTALALAYAFDRLARAPEIEARLRQEIQEVVGSRPARLSDIAQLPYTKAVVKETLRIYPPVWAVGRVAERSFSLAGATIQPGMVLVAVPWVVHHDERYYPEPDTFRPERFLNGAAEQLPKGAYLPFGAGPRTCIGNHFAELEMQLVLVTALQRYRFELVDAAPLRLSPSVTLRPAGPIRLRLASV